MNKILMNTAEEQIIVNKAFAFADKAHTGQKRKYTGEDYIVHPVAVARIVQKNGGDINMIQAALQHDTVEDCDVSYEDLREAGFNEDVIELVRELTKVSLPEDGNRAVRKAKDRDFLATVSARAQTIKYADLIHNSLSIIVEDPAFAKVFIREKIELLAVMDKGCPKLRSQALAICNSFLESEKK